ncbi:hypothetical protein ABK040_016702 [Willaertia magna]
MITPTKSRTSSNNNEDDLDYVTFGKQIEEEDDDNLNNFSDSTITPRRTDSNLEDEENDEELFIANPSPLREVRDENFFQIEEQLQDWIEKTLSTTFFIKGNYQLLSNNKTANVNHHQSPIMQRKDQSKNFYYNLENGVFLCKLVSHYFPENIDLEKLHEFQQPLFTFSNDKDYTTNYLQYAKNNIQLFLSGVRKIDGFPSELLFSFEDLFLQKNKKTILSCLLPLHEKALFHRQQVKEMKKKRKEEKELLKQVDKELNIMRNREKSVREDPKMARAVLEKIKRQSIISHDLVRRVMEEQEDQSVSNVILPKKKPLPQIPEPSPLSPSTVIKDTGNQITSNLENNSLTSTPSTPSKSGNTLVGRVASVDWKNILNEMKLEAPPEEEKQSGQEEGVIKSLISVATLPFIIFFVIAVKLYTNFFLKEKTN